jgi:hypothetical protein
MGNLIECWEMKEDKNLIKIANYFEIKGFFSIETRKGKNGNRFVKNMFCLLLEYLKCICFH